MKALGTGLGIILSLFIKIKPPAGGFFVFIFTERKGRTMQYRTKVIINGAELPDEQKENASSITSVTMTSSCGSGFQIGSTASSMLEFTVIRPYKESFDGDKVDFYVKPVESEDSVSILTTLEEQVGDTTATEHIEDSEDQDDIETEETEGTDEDVEDVSEEEEAESEAEMDELELGIFDLMNGEDASGEEPEEDGSEEVETGDGWNILGTFYVYKQTNNNDGTVTLQCYDGFQLMNDTYEPAQTKGTFQQFYDDIRSQCQEKGIIMDAETFEDDMNPELEWNQVCTLREAMGYLAGLLGGFATFGDDNTLGISFFGYDDEVLLTSELLSSTSTSAGETMVDGVICTINLNQDTIESGECGQPLCFYNPFMTQEILDGILEEYQGIRYTGAVVRTSWKPTLIPGEFVRLMTENEYMNYIAMNNALVNSSGMSAADILNLKKEINAVGKSLLVSTETVTFGGEAVAEIRSHLMTETEKANAPLSPSDAKFRIVTADLIKTKELVAEKASITDLEATNANIKNLQAADATISGKVTAAEGDIAKLKTEKANVTDLNATNATIKDLQAADATISGKVTAAEADINSVKADYVKASELDTKVANIANAEIGKATIKDAQIESINGNKIIDGSLVAAALSHEVVKNFRNNNIYYQAEAPEGEDLKEGDLWYKSLTKTSGDRAGVLFVYDGSGWVNKPFDSESILAKSITAAEIATGTITSSQLAAHTITANEIEAGTITAKEMNMENLQTNIARVGDSDGKHLDILADGIEIKDGTKQLAKYGDSVVIGDESSANVVIQNNEFNIINDGNKLFSVRKTSDACTASEIIKIHYDSAKAGYYAESTFKWDGKYKPWMWAIKRNSNDATINGKVDLDMPYTATKTESGKARISFEKSIWESALKINSLNPSLVDTIEIEYGTVTGGAGMTIGTRDEGAEEKYPGDWSMTIGMSNTATENSIAIGKENKATLQSATIGELSKSSNRSIAIGWKAKAERDSSAAIGYGVSTWQSAQLAIGYNNAEPTSMGNVSFVVGCGGSDIDKRNAAIITSAGDLRLKGTVYTGCDNDSSGGKSIIDLIYPVGSIYMSVNAADPSTLFGGTWERIQDSFLLGASDTYPAGKPGGSPDAVVVSHTHTQNKHSHTPSNGDGYMSYTSGSAERVKVSTSSGTRYAIVGKKSATSADASGLRYSDGTSSATPTINATGKSGKGANMPPYLAVYIWKRIS